VEDSGRGIDPSKIGRIFDPYYSAKSGGTGLGLSVCHAIVRRHGGEISVRSEPGKGSIFSFSLPASAAPAEEPVLDIPKGERTLALPARALVMDDEADLREILKAMLASYGCQADTAGGGREGLDMFSAALADGEPYGLVIADLTTPGGMGGAEMMKIMRGTDATFKSIIVSGYSDLPALAEYRKHGFDAFLRKPFTAAQLRDTLASLFGEA
jgi:CheY-like chemotaxis protein